jgi:cell division protein FtsX
VHDLDARLERLAADATRDAVAPEPAAIARRGRRRRRRQLAGSAALLVVAVVAAGMVLPARRAGSPAGHPAASQATDVRGAGMLTGHWFGRADASVFLAQHVDPARRQAIHDRIQALDVVDAVFFESRQEAFDRVKVLYRNRPDALKNVGPEAMPESFRVRLDDPDHFKQLFRALCRPADDAAGKQRCIRGIDLVAETQAALKPLLIGKAWLARSDLTVFLPEGTTAAEREAVRARLAAIDGVRSVVYESPAQAFRRLPEKWRKPDRNGVVPVLGPEAMHGSFRVTLDDPIRVGHVHQALCGSRKTGDCPFGLVLLDNRPGRDQATGAGAVRVRP